MNPMLNSPRSWKIFIQQAVVAGVLVTTLSLLLCVLPSHAQTSEPSIRPGTMGLDFSNNPRVDRLIGYEYVVLSPRAESAAQTLFSRGSKILFWIQPFTCTWNGQPLSELYYQGAVYALAQKYDALLKDRDGNLAEVTGHDISGCYVLDFSKKDFAKQLARLVSRRFKGSSGILLDYGCTDLSWEHSLINIDPGIWTTWADGYRTFREELHYLQPKWLFLCQCDRWGSWLPDVCDGLFLEKVGWSLNPYPKVWKTVAARNTRDVLLVYENDENKPDIPTRRMAAAISYITGSYFAYRTYSGGVPIQDPEHFELDLGEFDEPFTEISKDIYERKSTRGVVVANLSDKPYRYLEFTIPPNDGLVAQTRDTEGGAITPWKTTSN